MDRLWYKNVAYEDAKSLVKENLANTVAAFIASGYWLKYIRDNCGYEKDGYQSLWECAETEFGLKTSEASRAMSMNDKYSVDGNSPFMSDAYKKYNKSQLQEMLTMSDRQIEQVEPDMTIKTIREIKNSEYADKPCDIATDAVKTECEEELAGEIVTEIEISPEAAEGMDIEFDTNELMEELDDVVDGEAREIMETAGEEEDVIETEQPELPKFRNNEQRRAWLEDVEAWGLWYEDGNIQARYYKYDFQDGSRLIAVKYRYTCPPWLKDTENGALDGSYKNAYYHMIYSEEYRKSHKYEYERYYTNTTISIPALIEFVKEIARKVPL